ncbi:MAG: hypothetical protein WAY02_09450 [Burkholderiaceae bacterium]
MNAEHLLAALQRVAPDGSWFLASDVEGRLLERHSSIVGTLRARGLLQQRELYRHDPRRSSHAKYEYRLMI